MPSTYARLWIGLLAEGRGTVTVTEITQRLGVTPDAARMAIDRATDDSWLFSPVRGLHVIVPPDYRAWGVVPGERFIDAAMRHLDARYYVGYLSAAAHHGASYQAAQMFQVVVDRRLADRDLSGLRLRYYQTDAIGAREVKQVDAEFGRWVVATPETTLLDLVDRPDRGGGMGNVMTIAATLPVDGHALASQAHERGRATARRTGWVIERTRSDVDVAPLLALACPGVGAPTRLYARAESRGPIDRRWWVAGQVGVEAEA